MVGTMTLIVDLVAVILPVGKEVTLVEEEEEVFVEEADLLGVYLEEVLEIQIVVAEVPLVVVEEEDTNYFKVKCPYFKIIIIYIKMLFYNLNIHIFILYLEPLLHLIYKYCK